jgi:hypothetical protein
MNLPLRITIDTVVNKMLAGISKALRSDAAKFVDNRRCARMRLTLLLTAYLFIFAGESFAAERVIAAGRVLDSNGNAIEHATVLVYSAGVKRGFNRFCPTCYVDCGKRTFTGTDGTYTIAGLDSDLVFNFLIVREGYSTTFVKKVDPGMGSIETAVLSKRPSPENPLQIVRGRVVDRKGVPVRDALVEQRAAISSRGTSFGPSGWLDPIAVTNDQGDFEITYSKPIDAALVQVSPRGMSPKIATVSTGADRKPITVTEGATIRGRLLQNGKPVVQAEMGLSTHSRNSENYLPEVRVGTDDEGRFALTNVPPDRIWYLYARMEALAPRALSTEIIECATKSDGQDVDVGDIPVKPGYTLRGKIVLSDGRSIPPDMRINLFSDRVQDTQTLTLPPDGFFEFKGLARGVYDLVPSVKGYVWLDNQTAELLIEGEVSNLTVLLQPATSMKRSANVQSPPDR